MPKLDKIQHSSHGEHPLWHKPIETLYRCDGCCQLGFGMCYQCKTCDFQLHKECARASTDDIAYHPFFSKRVLVFRDYRPSRVRSCKACGDGVRGHRYKAWHRKALGSLNPFLRIYQHVTQKALHPCCAQLPPSLRADDGCGGDLVLRLEKNERGTSRCEICNNEEFSRGVKGWAYVSSCGKISFHVACVKRRVEEDWEEKTLEKQRRRRRMVLEIGFGAARLALERIVEALLGFPSKPVGELVESLLSYQKADL